MGLKKMNTAKFQKKSPPVSVLKKYEPEVPPKEIKLFFTGEVFHLELAENHKLEIPDSPRAFDILKTILRERYYASLAGAAPLLGSPTFPLQSQVDAWMKLHPEKTAEVSKERIERALAEMTEDEGGF